MAESKEFRELLTADAALMLGVAEARDVAAALQRYWDRREEPGASFEAELLHFARLAPDALRCVHQEVERLLSEAGGDAKSALTRRGGLDRSVHVALGKDGTALTHALSDLGVPVRAPLRALASDRYVDFSVAGVGGMGVVYAALDTEMNRRVAFKMVRPFAEETADETPRSPLDVRRPERDSPASETFEELKARLIQEAWVTGGLEHPGIVPVYEIGQTPTGIPFYTMRFVRGSRTLADAIREKAGAPFEQRLGLLEAFLKLCDAVRYAHDKGVIHRDLKPSNVALGEYGEVVLLDWGLSRFEGREDVAASAWSGKVLALREQAGLQTLEGGAMGTAGYMSPEAALGQLHEVDARSDVYSLGAILYEILTGRLPFTFRSFPEYAAAVAKEEPPKARDVDPSVPEPLSRLCAQALAGRRTERPVSALHLADAVRGWQASSAVEREVRALLRDARTALEAAAQVEGQARLRQVDRAAAALALVQTKDPTADGLSRLLKTAKELREEGIRQRERASARRLLQRIGIVVVLGGAVAAAMVTTFVQGKRREAEEARTATQAALDQVKEERDGKTRALDDVLRLADTKRAHDLVRQADELWPAVPDKVPDMSRWLWSTEALLDKADVYRDTLQKVSAQLDGAKGRPPDGSSPPGKAAEIPDEETEARRRLALEWQKDVLKDLLTSLDSLAGTEGRPGIRQRVEDRRTAAATLKLRSIEKNADAWRETIDGVSSSPKYRGLRLAPQIGLVPLGPDPDSGLFEFAHLGSGSVPTRDPSTKRLVYADDAAVVLVLVPRGRFPMGAQRTAPEDLNYDPEAQPIESPVHRVVVSPFFLAKHECTQAQWRTITEGARPSSSAAGSSSGERTVTDRNPVEEISWLDSATWLARVGLTLPTEAEWEYACRGGVGAPWSFGAEAAMLSRVANYADEHFHRNQSDPEATHSAGDDGHSGHAPVGSFRPNLFGLYDVHGNVAEWCRDALAPYTADPEEDPQVDSLTPRRLIRGGSWATKARDTRSAARSFAVPAWHSGFIGVRPARGMDPAR